VEIIEFLISLSKPLVWIWNKLSQKSKESKLYSLYKQLAYSYKLYQKTKKLYLLKKKSTLSLQKTDEFECLFRKFCVDIIDFRNKIYASTQCSEQRIYLSEITMNIKKETNSDFIAFKEFYKFYREYVKKSSDCITYKNNTTFNEHKKQLLDASKKFYKSIVLLLTPLYCLLNQEEKIIIEEKISVKH
jgi:hypothetical protein